MEHITIQETKDGLFRLTAEPGFKLYSALLGRPVSEAIVHQSEFQNFIAKEDDEH